MDRHGAASQDDETRSRTGKELGTHNPGRWKSLRDGLEAGEAWHILRIVRRLMCLELSMVGRVNDLGSFAKITQSLSTVFRFYSTGN